MAGNFPPMKVANISYLAAANLVQFLVVLCGPFRSKQGALVNQQPIGPVVKVLAGFPSLKANICHCHDIAVPNLWYNGRI